MGSSHGGHSAGGAGSGRKPFLTARWSNLLLVSYRVKREVLEPLVPAGCELDLFEGQPAVSLVAFDFLDTRVKGVRWPGCVNFPEINLRYYVRQKGRSELRRGVSFVQELVPKRMIAWSARLLYNEPYVACPMKSRVWPSTVAGELSSDGVERPGIEMRHEFRLGGASHTIGAIAEAESWMPEGDSPEHWFKEHQWGFGRTRRGRTLVYEVRHPFWEVHTVRHLSLQVDYAKVYGPAWAFLKDVQPISMVWAKGSEIGVYPHGPA